MKTPFNMGARALSLLFAAALGLATVAVYSRTLGAPFIFDDLGNIVSNPNIRGPLFSLKSFTPPPVSGITRRPVVHFTLALSWAMGGGDPAAFHAFNIAVHVIAALLLFGILTLSFQSPRLAGRFGPHAALLAFFSALLWAVHPLQTQAVTYVIQRCESLMGMFFLGVVYCAIRGFRSPRPAPWHALAVILFFLGAGVKEVMAAAPPMILLYDLVLSEKPPRRVLADSKLLYGGLAAGLLFLAYLVISGLAVSVTGHERVFSAAQYLVSQPLVIFRYLSLSVLPRGQCLDYDWGAFPLSRTWPYGLAIVALIAATAWALVRRRPAGLAGAWFFLCLAPSSSFVPVPDIIFEHRMYLSLAALTTLFVTGSYRCAPRRAPWLCILVCLWTAAAAALGIAAFERNRVYQSAVSIFADTAAKAPENPRALANLGMALLKDNRPQDAVFVLSRALALKDDIPGAWYDLGNAWAALGKMDKAKGAYAIALKVYPYNPRAWLNLGNALLATGETEKAALCYRNVLRLIPDSPEARRNLAVAQAQEGKK